MPKKTNSIPVNTLPGDMDSGIVIGRGTFYDSNLFEALQRSHRDNYHLFFLQEKGTSSIEIDFKKYKIEPSSVVYIHPNQVHRLIAFEHVTLSGWGISNEKLNPEYLELLEEITPAKPLVLNKETFAVISEAVSLCLKFSERKHEKLYQALLKDSCNILVALMASQYLAGAQSKDGFLRSEIIGKAFRTLLERNFITTKKPAEYARALNISTAYLNECIKNTTGQSVSFHIQQRIVLEAQRLLYHSDKSVKEIATELGYDEYNYFSRLFTKVTGMSALAFRNKTTIRP